MGLEVETYGGQGGGQRHQQAGDALGELHRPPTHSSVVLAVVLLLPTTLTPPYAQPTTTALALFHFLLTADPFYKNTVARYTS